MIYILPFIIGSECLAAILAGLFTEKTIGEGDLDFAYIKNCTATRTNKSNAPFAHKEIAVSNTKMKKNSK